MSKKDRSSKIKGTKENTVVPKEERARKEVENGYKQFDLLKSKVEEGLTAEYYRLRPSDLLDLNRAAVAGLVENPGVFRLVDIEIDGSKHAPPPPNEVPKFVDLLCEYVNDNWGKSALHLSAYVMWRLNWIHPFEDGNGRTARAVAYLVLCVRLGAFLPGDKTIPQQISNNKDPYYDALEAADEAIKSKGDLDLSSMEKLLEDLLEEQIRQAATSTWEGTRRTVVKTAPAAGGAGSGDDSGRKGLHPAIWAAIIGGIFLLAATLIKIGCDSCSSEHFSSKSPASRTIQNHKGRPICKILSYTSGSSPDKLGRIEVVFKNVNKMDYPYVAAASANAEDSIFVQRGKALKKDGGVSLEGWKLKGRVIVLQATSASGESYLVAAQKDSIKGIPRTSRDISKADVVERCEYIISD